MRIASHQDVIQMFHEMFNFRHETVFSLSITLEELNLVRTRKIRYFQILIFLRSLEGFPLLKTVNNFRKSLYFRGG